MLYISHTPAAPLREFVANFWLFGDAPAHAGERIVPSGTLELVVNLADDEFRVYEPARPGRYRRYSGAMVSGAYGRHFVTDTRQQACIMGVHFRPAGAFPFLGMPAGELADTHVDLQTLWGRGAAAELRERLCAAGTPEERFAVMERSLMAHLVRPPGHHAAVPVAVEALARAGAKTRVRDVARRVGLSQRRFIEVFTAQVGMTPKLFARVRRFQRALDRARVADAPDWARLAVECGYYDQSQLIGDFRAFSGLTPTEYARRRGVPVKENHVPL